MQHQPVHHQMHQSAALYRCLESLNASLCLHDRPPQLLVDQHRIIVFDLKSPVQPAENMNCSRLVIRPSTIHHYPFNFLESLRIWYCDIPEDISFSEDVMPKASDVLWWANGLRPRMALQEFSSISFHMANVFSRFCLAISRFFAVRSSLSALRHLLTWVLMSLQPPNSLWMNPCAWHSSRAVMTSSQPTYTHVNRFVQKSGEAVYLCWSSCEDEDAS